MNQTNNKRIAKNTMFLYFRMMFTMVVALYTSRVVLQILGIDNYGIYQTVGGIVGFLSFMNNALATGSSRFLTFELGTGNKEKLSKTFSTTLTVHILLALFIIIIAETLGLWFLHNKLVIDPEKMNAAVFVFHISILTAAITITQVPYNASIIAHERMSVFAYVSIVEVSSKLAIVYLLNVGNYDKLKLYAILLSIIQIGVMIFYRFYCTRSFKETKYRFTLDRSIFKSVASFSGWSLLSNASQALDSQGILILINMFFSPAVVAARAISIQVNMAAEQFVDNFRTAVNPQIVKQYASKNYEGSKQLLLSSTKYSYYLMLVLSLPIYILAEPLLNLWLTEVPEYTVIFLQLIVIESLFHVFNTSFYTALYAKGQLKENALITPILGFLMFPLVYLLFKAGYSPVTLSWISLFMAAILGLIVKPILIVKIVDYRLKDILKVLISCFSVTIVAIPIPLLSNHFLNGINNIFEFIEVVAISITCVAVSVFFIGVNTNERAIIINQIKKKLKI